MSDASDPAASGPVTNALGTVLPALDGPLTALFRSLGVHGGGADVTVVSLHASQPALAR